MNRVYELGEAKIANMEFHLTINYKIILQMKKLITVCLLLLLAVSIFPQDLLVRMDGTQKKGKILAADSVKILMEKAGLLGRKTEVIPFGEVKSFVLRDNQAAWLGDSASRKIMIAAPSPAERYAMLPRFRVYAGGGYVYRTAPIAGGLTPAYVDYIRRSKSGMDWNAGASWFFSEHYGLTVDFSHFRSIVTAFDMPVYSGDIVIDTSDLQDLYKMSYANLQMTRRFFLARQRLILITGAGAGFNAYSDHAIVGKKAILIRGNAIGLNAGLSLDYYLYKGLTLGVDLSYIYAGMKNITANGVKYKLSDYTGQKSESLSRLQWNIGLRTYF